MLFWQGKGVIEVPDSPASPESWCYSHEEADTVPAETQELATMGRGPAWTADDLDTLQKGLINGKDTPVSQHVGF